MRPDTTGDVADDPVTVFEADTRGLPPVRRYIENMWERRQFTLYLARADLKAHHYDTVLGQVWNIFDPLLMGAVYMLLFTVLRPGQRTGTAIAALIFGLFLFQYTRHSLERGSRSLITGQRLLLNAVFPRAVLPFSTVLGAALMFIPSAITYLPIHLLLGRPIGPALLFIPVLFAILTVFNLGLALFFSVLTVYFRDTANFLPYLLRLWMYVTPVLYLDRQVPRAIRPYLRVNPLYPLFAATQRVLAGAMPLPGQLAAATFWAIVFFVAGGLYFLIRERDIAVRL